MINYFKSLFSKKKYSNNNNFDFELIGRYFNNVINYKSFYHVITDKISIDLDINELFTFIDRTISKVGQQFLYFKLRTIQNKNELLKFNEFVEIFENNTDLRNRCKKSLRKLNNDNSYYFEELIHGTRIIKPYWINLSYFLSGLVVILFFISFTYLPVLIFLLPIFIINLIFHYKNKAYINLYLIAVSEFTKNIKTAKKLIKEDEIIKYFNDLSFFERIIKVKKKSRFISFEKQLNNEFLTLFWGISEIIKIIFNLDIILFYRFIDDVVKEKESINKLFMLIGEVDSAISVACLRKEYSSVCKPVFTQNKNIEVKNIIHPLIENCIPNSLILKDKSIILTGSNMSGKTTFIRTVAINSILAQTIFTCFAENYKAPFFKIFSSIRISDNLFENKSYYLEEVLTIKEFINVSDFEDPCLFILDEIFKGTNTAERISGGKAVLSYLHKKNHFVFVSTHDIELTTLLKGKYELYHFQEQIIDNKLFFDHKLKINSLKTKNAIKILELYNYPAIIINDAKNVLNNLLLT